MFNTHAVLAIAGILLTSSSVLAQDQAAPAHKPHFEFNVVSGKVLPTGAQRDAIKSANLSLAQLSYVIHPSFAITASAGWARTRDVASVGEPRLDMFTYDVGGEVRANRWTVSKTFGVTPFAGIGVGGRSYNYRSRAVDATHNLAGYASAGSELGIGNRVKLRVEARDYVSGFKPLAGGDVSDTRNDVSLVVGLRLKVR